MHPIRKFKEWREEIRKLSHVKPYEIEPEWNKDKKNLGKFMASFVSPEGQVFLYYLDGRELTIVRRFACGMKGKKFLYDFEYAGSFSFRENVIKVGFVGENFRELGLFSEAIKLLEPEMRKECEKNGRKMECIRIVTSFKDRAKAAKKRGFKVEAIKKRKIKKKQKTFYLVRKLH